MADPSSRCPHCGAPLPEDVLVCPTCHSPVDLTLDAPPPPVVSEPLPEPVEHSAAGPSRPAEPTPASAPPETLAPTGGPAAE
ncbi:MAG: zinc-ribbon domain-containing protein, partial [Thermoplasmata archaeon]